MPFYRRSHFDRLETRRLLSALVEATSFDDFIVVTESEGNLIVSVNGVESLVPIAETEHLTIQAGEGNDTIDLRDLATLPTSIDAGEGDDVLFIGAGDWSANIVAPVTLRGGAGMDRVTIDDSLATSANNNVAFTNPFNIDTQAAKPGAGTLFIDAGTPESAVEQIVYIGSANADSIALLGLSSFSTITLLGGEGDDSIRLGDDFDSKIAGGVTIDGEAGTNTLTLDDSADGFGDTYFFEGTASAPTFRKNSGGGTIAYRGVSHIDLLAGASGTGAHSQFFRVTALLAGATLSINAGGGDDSLTLGAATLDLATIQSAITFSGGTGIDRVDVIDALGSDPSTYTLVADTIQISDLPPITILDVERLSLLGNNAPNLFDVQATTGRLNATLNGGGGDDTFRIGAGDLDATIATGVSIIGGAGVDQLLIDDTLDDAGNDTYTLASGQLSKSTIGVHWSTSATDATDIVRLLASANADTIRILSTSPAVALHIDAGEGDDAIFVERTSDGTNGATPVTITSGAGSDSLTVNSDGLNADAIVVLDAEVETLSQLDIRAGGRLSLLAGGDRLLVIENALNINGHLDLNNQTLLVRNGDFTAIENRVAIGHNGGLWTTNAEPAVISTHASMSSLSDALATVRAETVGLPSYLGVATNAGDIIVRYTLNGDANLDRLVGFADLLVVAQNYDSTLGSRTWVQGNFNYQSDAVPGSVAFGDLLLLAQNYGSTLLSVLPVSSVAAKHTSSQRIKSSGLTSRR